MEAWRQTGLERPGRILPSRSAGARFSRRFPSCRPPPALKIDLLKNYLLMGIFHQPACFFLCGLPSTPGLKTRLAAPKNQERGQTEKLSSMSRTPIMILMVHRAHVVHVVMMFGMLCGIA